jgi:AraC family transcriptional regulator
MGRSVCSENVPVCPAGGTSRSVMRYRRAWAGATAEVVELVGPGRHVEDLLSQKPRLVVALEEIGGYLETRLAPGQPSRSGCHLSNHLAYFPAGTRAWEFAERFRYIRRIAIDFEPAVLSGVAGTHWSRYQQRLMFSNAHVWTLADLLADECALPQTENPLYGESLVLVIFHSLFRHRESEGGGRRSRGLTPRQLRRVTDYMKQSSSIHLRDLADMSGLSQAYFSRAFKASTGMAPRRWHLTEKVRRAQQIMIETGDSLAEVALASGFADQSHFTRVFRDITGESPAAWRRVRTSLNSE